MIDQYQNQKQQFNLHIPSFALQVKSEGRVICKIHRYSAPLQTVWCEILIFLETAWAGDIWKHAINMPKKSKSPKLDYNSTGSVHDYSLAIH